MGIGKIVVFVLFLLDKLLFLEVLLSVVKVFIFMLICEFV